MILQILPGFCRCYQTTFFLGWINREILHGKEQFWCSQFKDASSLVAVSMDFGTMKSLFPSIVD
jgi:hypothetical protein